ncbi:MAG: DUF1844 domain-containing protein [Acidobacteria bacterium]|nr:DUF1844 domain-containing protein [Acidobacteriota bacterium]
MAEKKDTGFTVTDRRLFTAEGDLRRDVDEEQGKAAAAGQEVGGKESGSSAPTAPAAEDVPAPPTAAEQQAQKDAYQKSSKDLDSRVELGGHSSTQLEMTFERFIASLYMSAMLQLGLMHEEGSQPNIDLIGARQTIDTLGLLAEKTKGNLNSREENFLQNSLYELRMAYVEVTNSLARPPQTSQGIPKAR